MAQIQIGTQRFDFFNRNQVHLRYGYSASTFNFTALFESDVFSRRDIFRPLSYQDVIISDGNETLITGTVLRNRFSRSSSERLSSLMGYTKTGVLSDCHLSVGNYPRQFNNLSFREIAQRLISPFGLNLVTLYEGIVSFDSVDNIIDEIIPDVTIDTTQNLYDFLNQIISQRNLVLTHDDQGNLLVTRANATSNPIANFSETAPVTSISLDINGQGLHSEISVLNQQLLDSDNSRENIITNPLVGSFRPRVSLQSVGNDVTIAQASRNVRSNELRSIRLSIQVNQWEWPGTSQIMRPNNVITVTSPSNYIFDQTNFFVEEVRLSEDPNKRTAELACVLPEVYTGEDPQPIF